MEKPSFWKHFWMDVIGRCPLEGYIDADLVRESVFWARAVLTSLVGRITALCLIKRLWSSIDTPLRHA